MNQLFKCKDFLCKVFVEDTDFQGVVYHANYLKYFERARSQFLIDHNLSQVDALLNEETYIVRSINLNYRDSAKLDDQLVIKSDVELISKARIKFFQSALRLKNDTLICDGIVEVCYLRKDIGKPKAFPQKLLDLFG